MTTSPRPLDGILVIALEQAVAAPLATCRLADAGARVIKIERDRGDFARHYDSAAGGESAYFAWLNRGKQSIVLDIKDGDDRGLLDRLLARADVFVQNLAPGAAARSGLGADELRRRHPRLVTCDISGYGESGPYRDRRAYDLLVQAESGLASITGRPEGPGRVGVSACDIAAGLYAHAAILEALLLRQRTGQGRAIQVSLFDCMADWMTVPLLHLEHTGYEWPRVGLAHPTIAPYGAFPTHGGAEILIAVQNDDEFRRLASEVLNEETIADDPRFRTNRDRVEHRAELERLLADRFVALDRAELEGRLDRARIAYAAVSTVADLSRHPQLRRTPLTTPHSTIEIPAPPAIVDGEPPSLGRVPALGEHSAAIRREFGAEPKSQSMPEQLSPEQRDLAERTRRLLDDELRPLEQSLDVDPNVAVPAELRGRVRERSRAAGIYTLTQPRELGGDGAGPLALTVVREAIAAAHLRLGRWVLGPDPGALRQAEGELCRLYLEPVLRGEKQGAFAFTEPHDAAAPTRAVRDDDAFVVDGAKSYVTGGADADFFMTVVRVVDGAATAGSSTALLAIDRDLPGVIVEREFASLEGGRHVALRFTGARVPVDRVVGAIGEGMPRALRAIGDTRLAVAALAVGSSLWALDFVTRHLRAPHRRGAPLGDLESIRLRYGELRIQVYAARSVLYRTARLVEAGGNVVNETMAAKVLATETLGTIADQAIQLVGGDALVVGHPLERLYREARSLRLAEGSSDLLRLQIARGALELEKGRL